MSVHILHPFSTKWVVDSIDITDNTNSKNVVGAKLHSKWFISKEVENYAWSDTRLFSLIALSPSKYFENRIFSNSIPRTHTKAHIRMYIHINNYNQYYKSKTQLLFQIVIRHFDDQISFSSISVTYTRRHTRMYNKMHIKINYHNHNHNCINLLTHQNITRLINFSYL